MSYDFMLYVKRDSLPGTAVLNHELAAAGISVPRTFDIKVASGFVSVLDAGFECSISAITAWHVEDHIKALKAAQEPDDEQLVILRSSDALVCFGCRTEREVELAGIVVGALGKLSGGYVCDPQTGEVVHGGYLSIPPLF